MVIELKGGTTMKIKKMAGALALSAALAMGTAMPAFAASATEETAFSGTDGSTEIKASVLDTQLQATVPLHVAIVFNADSGVGDIKAPDASKYAITNTGEGSIKVTEATIENGDAVEKAGLTIAGWYWYNKNNNAYGIGNAKHATTGNYVMLTFDDGTNVTYLAPDHPLSAANAEDDQGYMDTMGEDVAATDHTVVTIDKDSKLPIQLGGKTRFGTAVDNTQLTDVLCTIKYTIAKA